MTKENNMVYGMEMNLHQVDQYTIQMYILGDETKLVRVEHPGKHPNRTKANGEPYALEHKSLFNILKTQLIKQGKWKIVCSGCGFKCFKESDLIIAIDDEKAECDRKAYCPVCDAVIERGEA